LFIFKEKNFERIFVKRLLPQKDNAKKNFD
jgi:hypothetical protein